MKQTVAPGAQYSAMASSAFSLGSGAQGWAQIGSNQNTVVGLDILAALPALDVLETPSHRWFQTILTDIEYNSSYATEIDTANTSNFSNDIEVDLYDLNGNAIGSPFTATLAPKGRVSQLVAEHVPQAVTQPFLGYAVVTGDSTIAAAEVLSSSVEIAILGGQPMGPYAQATTLYASHFETGKGALGSRLTLVNPTTTAANVTVMATGANGAAIGQPVPIALAAGQQSQTDIGTLLSLNPANLTVGSLTIQTKRRGRGGGCQFLSIRRGSTRGAAFLYVLDGTPSQFAYFAAGDGIARDVLGGFAVQNINASATNVAVRAFGTTGTLAGSAQFSLPANARFSGLLSKLIPQAAALLTGGYFTVESSQPVSATSVFGLSTLSTYSASPALKIAGVGRGPTTTDPPSTVVNNSMTGIVGQSSIPTPTPTPTPTPGSATITVAPGSLSFGNVTVGQTPSPTLIVTLQLTGATGATVKTIITSNPLFAATAATPFPVSANGTPLAVTFTPTATGPQGGALIITTVDGTTVTVNLSGTGVAAGSTTPPAAGPPKLSAPTSIGFGSVAVGKPAMLTVQLSNAGGAALNVSSLAAGGAFSVVSPSAPFTPPVPAGSPAMAVTLQLNASTAGAQSGHLTIRQ